MYVCISESIFLPTGNITDMLVLVDYDITSLDCYSTIILLKQLAITLTVTGTVNKESKYI